MDTSTVCSPPAPKCVFCATLPAEGSRVVNEVAETTGLGVELEELAIPTHSEVKGMCEILGLDPFISRREVVCIVARQCAALALATMARHDLARAAATIGRIVVNPPARVVMHTVFGGKRIVDMLVGEQLPRMC